ncbi:hypothetical protein [Sphingobium sp. CAP-1]|uniref:hypothetical protein n=1 Tax=Sphingobium sp. CAP-1 TaxID=2676077 RepID=UPI0012BB3C5A|nr:hypothetical protein [Sphingobium sp. CAP-1]QGP79449.1 hypothetical protein GL174_11005 [Sphingobium sp. CAP-1]
MAPPAPERPAPDDAIPDDMEDLVEKMEAMTRSGRIDMGAYAGEPAMNEEEDGYGASKEEEED